MIDKTSLAAIGGLLALVPLWVLAQGAQSSPPPTMSEVLASSRASDWRAVDPGETLYLELPRGRVIIELAPGFAPRHVANIKALVKERYYDGLFIVRSQENYVVQWGDPAEDPAQRRPLESARASLPAEFSSPISPDLSLSLLPDGDVYAPNVGFSQSLPVALDPATDRIWLAHCYGMVGVGRDEAPESGSGAEMYVVIGHAPRHLDRNVTLVGRVLEGMELLSTLPRGTGSLGFYEDPSEFVPVQSIRLGSELSEQDRVALEVLRTDTPTFEALVASRRFRHEPWFADSVGRVELCNVPLPVRRASAS